MKMLAALVSLALSSSALAISMDDGVKFPTKLSCKYVNSADHDEADLLYTRITGITQLDQLPDADNALTVWGGNFGDGVGGEPLPGEIAEDWSGEYYGATLDRDFYNYNLWTCDTEDRTYTFATNDLVLPAWSGHKTKKVAGKVDISVRGEGDVFDLDCIATY